MPQEIHDKELALPDTRIGHENATPPGALVEQIRGGNSEAESELVKRYSRSLMLMLQRRTGDVQRAEDVHQEAFCIVIERLRSKGIEHPDRLSAFIHKTAINVMIGEYRKDSRRKTYTDMDAISRQTDRSPSQLKRLIRAEADYAIRMTIQEMSNSRDRELLYRFYIIQEEKPIVCRALELSSTHFDRVISRARKRFRQLVEKKRGSLDESGQVA